MDPTSIGTDPDLKSSPWKYFPCQLGESEHLERYEPGGFHPVHLGDVYDGRYRVVHKLGFRGFSTVWLARDTISHRWAALKIVVARESPTYEACSTIASHPSVIQSAHFAIPDRRFWIDGPNGRHLCLVGPVLGPDLAKLSKGIYSRTKPDFTKEVSLQAARALAQLHASGICHGDFTVHNMAVRLTDRFDLYDEADLIDLFGHPATSPVLTYSGQSAKPHAPDYIVVALDFLSSTTPILSREICIFDFDQSFAVENAPSGRPGIPAKYIAPEVAVGRTMSPSSDIWALGCAIFRLRSGDDLFFDYDTCCPEDALRQIAKFLGELPDDWKQTRFDEDGFAVADGQEGDPFWTLDVTERLEDRIDAILDEPPSLFINDQGQAVEPVDTSMDDQPGFVIFDPELRGPFPAAIGSLAWRPTAIYVSGGYFTGYSEETAEMLKAFPRISGSESRLLNDLLSRIFTYDPAKRVKAEDILKHAWSESSIWMSLNKTR